MNLLFIGDIVGKGGRKALQQLVPELRKEFKCSFVIANLENAAAGSGLNKKCITQVHPDFVDVITTGDHVWDQKGFELEIEQFKSVLRPANLNDSQPGRGFGVYRNPASGDIAVINIQGKTFMKESAYCPFAKVDEVLSKIPKNIKCRIVDFHAEATSEKKAMGYHLNGRVTAVLGTHTHVQTADARILSGGTAYITDTGMVGSEDSVLGREVDAVLDKFISGMPRRLPVHNHNIRLDAVVISYNVKSGKAEKITPISRMADSV